MLTIISYTSERSVSFEWGKDTVRGLNIGGWLVLEPWITPSIFEGLDQSLGIVDEYTLTEKLGTEAALAILQPHVSIFLKTCLAYNAINPILLLLSFLNSHLR